MANAVKKEYDRTEIIKCPNCGEVMLHDKEFGYWKCPRCDWEVWPKVEIRQAEMPPALVNKMVRETYEEEIRTGYVPGKKKNRSKSGRTKKAEKNAGMD